MSSYDDIGGYANDQATCEACGRARDPITRCPCEYHHTPEPPLHQTTWLLWSAASPSAQPIPYYTEQSVLAAAKRFGGRVRFPDGRDQEFPIPAWVVEMNSRLFAWKQVKRDGVLI